MINRVIGPYRQALLLLAIALLSGFAGASGRAGDDPPLTAKQVFESVKDSVVRVETDQGTGTGFFYSDGKHVATCLHVLEGASGVVIRSTEGGTAWVPVRVSFDRATDLAVLELGEDSRRKPIPAGKSKDLEIGDPVFVVGNPLGFLAGTLSTGILSGRRVAEEIVLLQTNAAISPGSSGSPLLDGQGKVAGVMGLSFEEGQALNMAVAIEHLGSVLKGTYQPISVLEKEGNPEDKVPADSRSKEEIDAAKRMTGAFTDLWGGMQEQVLLWMCEMRTDRISSGVNSPLELSRRTLNRALKLVEASQKKAEFEKLLATRGKDPKPAELLGAVPALAARLANAITQFDHWATSGKDKEVDTAGDEMSNAVNALKEGLGELENWAMGQDWFEFSTYEDHLSPPVYGYLIGPFLVGVYPDALKKTSCNIAWVTGDDSELKVGDRITAYALTASGPFTTVGSWRDLNDKLWTCDPEPDSLYVQVDRKGKAVVVKVKLSWPKVDED